MPTRNEDHTYHAVTHRYSCSLKHARESGRSCRTLDGKPAIGIVKETCRMALTQIWEYYLTQEA